MQSAVEKLRKYRDENYRSHDEVVDLWTDILSKRNLSSFGDEKWLILEQVFKSALHCSKQSIANECLEQLKKQFKSTSRRVTTLDAMYFESIGEFGKAEDIYSALLEDNETDAIVRKRQIGLLKEQNHIREAISELNSYLELYQVRANALLRSTLTSLFRLIKRRGENCRICICTNTITPKQHFARKNFF